MCFYIKLYRTNSLFYIFYSFYSKTYIFTFILFFSLKFEIESDTQQGCFYEYSSALLVVFKASFRPFDAWSQLFIVVKWYNALVLNFIYFI